MTVLMMTGVDIQGQRLNVTGLSPGAKNWAERFIMEVSQEWEQWGCNYD